MSKKLPSEKCPICGTPGQVEGKVTKHFVSHHEELLRQARAEADELYAALDFATDLLPVPEHAQDEDWYAKQRVVMDAFIKAKAAREGGEDE